MEKGAANNILENVTVVILYHIFCGTVGQGQESSFMKIGPTFNFDDKMIPGWNIRAGMGHNIRGWRLVPVLNQQLNQAEEAEALTLTLLLTHCCLTHTAGFIFISRCCH